MRHFGMLPGGGEVRSSGGIVDHGDRRRSRMEAMPPATNHLGEGGFGLRVVQGG